MNNIKTTSSYRWNRNARVHSDTVRSFARMATVNGLIAMTATAAAVGMDASVGLGLLTAVPVFAVVWLVSIRCMAWVYVEINETHAKPIIPPTLPPNRRKIPVYNNGRHELDLDG